MVAMDSTPTLEKRFFHSFLHFNLFLKVYGINLEPSPESKRWKRWLFNTLGAFWLIVNLQSAIYLYFKRALRDLRISLITAKTSSAQMDAFNGFILCTNPLVFFCLTHIYLIVTGRQTIRLLLKRISLLDSQMDRPDLMPSIRPYSFAAIAWTFLIVRILNVDCSTTIK